MNILENTEKWANFDTLIQKRANFEFFSFLAKIGGGEIIFLIEYSPMMIKFFDEDSFCDT